METFIEALKKLKEGDVCFAHSDHNPAHFDDAVRHDLADHGQHPYAAVITCGDSRVPPGAHLLGGAGQPVRHPQRRQRHRPL